MNVIKSGTVSTQQAPAEYFTGKVWMDPINQPPAPARIAAGRVTFEPGARTHWHTHPLGQTLYVVSGCGRVQTEGGPVLEIQPGDVVWIPPGEKHWHGAAPNSMMCHIALQERMNDSAATWLEPVSEAQYAVAPRPAD